MFFCVLIFYIKIILILILFCLIRAALPRYRYDQLMNLDEKFYYLYHYHQ